MNLGVDRKEGEGGGGSPALGYFEFAKTWNRENSVSFQRTIVLVLMSFTSISLTPKYFTFSKIFLKHT